MEDMYMRTTMLLGNDAVDRIKRMKIAVFGVGGVGSFVVETLVRAGVGAIVIADFDTVNITNINRQLIALHSTIDRKKIDAERDRLLDINPLLHIDCYDIKIDERTIFDVDLSGVTYVVDAIDGVEGKVAIIKRAKQLSIPVISSMGTGNKLDPMRFKIADISQTQVCPLARRVRKRLKEEGINGVDALYSDELPGRCDRVPASVSFVPSVAGILIAREIIIKNINSNH